MKIDLGCGEDKKQGYLGIDNHNYTDFYLKGEFIKSDLREELPFKDNTIDKIYSSQTLNYLNTNQFIKIMKEIHRVLKPDSKAEIITHHFSSQCSHHFIYKIFIALNTFLPIEKAEKIGCEYTMPDFELINIKLYFDKRIIYFWNYLIEFIVNLHPKVQTIWENTFLRSLFPATFIRFVLRK